MTRSRVRPHVTIAGVYYELRRREEFGAEEWRALTTELVLALVQSGMLDRVCRRLLIAPDDVHQRLGDGHRRLIIEAYAKDASAATQAVAAWPRRH